MHARFLADLLKALFDLLGFFPFGFFSKLFYGARAGKVHLQDGRLLYINRGTGTWGPPMRVFSPPEVTLFEIVGTGPAAATR